MLLLLVLIASDPGFGGTAGADAPCRVFVDGAWASCDAYLDETAPLPPRAPSREPDAVSEDAAPAVRDDAPRTLEPFQTTQRKARVVPMQNSGPLSDALRRGERPVVDTPLSRVRDEAAALERAAEDVRTARRETRGDDVLYNRGVAAAAEASDKAAAVLGDVEVYALRLRERCQNALPENEDGERPWARSVALTVGRPLSVTEPEVRAALAELDAPECERVNLITEMHVEKFRRYHALNAQIAASQSYSDIALRRRLEAERAEIGRMLRGTDLSAPTRATVSGPGSLAPVGFESSGTGYKTLGGPPTKSQKERSTDPSASFTPRR